MFQSMRGADIHELITWENSAEQGMVRFEMLSDPCLEGTVLNVAIAFSPSSTKVMYLMDWHYRADVAAEAQGALPGQWECSHQRCREGDEGGSRKDCGGACLIRLLVILEVTSDEGSSGGENTKSK